jgi:hypothetical protein
VFAAALLKSGALSGAADVFLVDLQTHSGIGMNMHTIALCVLCGYAACSPW